MPEADYQSRKSRPAPASSDKLARLNRLIDLSAYGGKRVPLSTADVCCVDDFNGRQRSPRADEILA